MSRIAILGALALAGAGCKSLPESAPGPAAPHARAADATMIAIPGGPYIAGSTVEERQQAYDDHRETSGSNAATEGQWFADEVTRHRAELPAFRIDQAPVTNAAYAEFVADTGARPPAVDRETWRRQGFVQNYDEEVARMNWPGTRPPTARGDHPVVLVTHEEAAAYCAWRGRIVGEPRRLPSEAEYEKAARGDRGLTYPWGNDWDASALNSAVSGPRDTVAVGNHPGGASPYGVLDAAGNAFQWTSSPWPGADDSFTVKGSAWDDHAGVGRGASRHGRPAGIRHAIVGFRCAAGGG